MSELKRKKNESFEAFMRRVKQTWQRSGTVLQARKIQYFAPSRSRNVVRKQAVSRAKLVSKTDYLRKAGKLPADDKKGNRRKRR